VIEIGEKEGAGLQLFSRLIQTVVNSLNPALPSHPEDIKRESLTDGQTFLTHCHRDATIWAFLQFVMFWIYFFYP